jgi:hypothetical protein
MCLLSHHFFYRIIKIFKSNEVFKENKNQNIIQKMKVSLTFVIISVIITLMDCSSIQSRKTQIVEVN